MQLLERIGIQQLGDPLACSDWKMVSALRDDHLVVLDFFVEKDLSGYWVLCVKALGDALFLRSANRVRRLVEMHEACGTSKVLGTGQTGNRIRGLAVHYPAKEKALRGRGLDACCPDPALKVPFYFRDAQLALAC